MASSSRKRPCITIPNDFREPRELPPAPPSTPTASASITPPFSSSLAAVAAQLRIMLDSPTELTRKIDDLGIEILTGERPFKKPRAEE